MAGNLGQRKVKRNFDVQKLARCLRKPYDNLSI